MNIEQIHQRLIDQFGSDKIVELHTESIDPWIVVAPVAIVEVATFLRDDPELSFKHLNDLCGVDYLSADPAKAAKFGHDPHLEVVYHLSSLEHGHRLKVKVKLDRWKDGQEGQIPDVDSVAGVWGIADWHEREAYDLVGIRFNNHPNLRRILCPEDWVGHPLRKDYDFPLEYHGIRGK